MKAKQRTILILGLVLAVAAVVAAVFFLWKPQPKGITVAVSNLPDSLNPIMAQNTSGMNASELVFDGLVNFEVDSQGRSLYPELALAESIEQDPVTKKTYTVLLREVFWHDGSELTADDVVYSFNAYMDPANESPSKPYLSSFIEKVEAVDSRTVRIEFHKPLPPFRVYPVLTFKIIPSSYRGARMDTNLRAGENERNFAVEPVGTGPYRLTGWEIGKWVSFAANGTYFRRVPSIETLLMKKVIDPIIRMNELRRGRISMILETSPMDRPKVEKMGNVDINSYLPYAFYQVCINSKLFPDANARAAMSLAMDRAAMVPGITDRTSGIVRGSSLFPSDLFTSTIPEYVNSPVPDLLPEDLARAKTLAASSGLDGQTAILLYPDSLGEFGSALAKSVVDQLARIGLKVEAKRTGDQVFRRLVFTERNFELALTYSEGFDNLYSSLGSQFRSNGEQNVTGIADSDLDALFDQWEKAVVTTEWVDLTLRINEKVAALAPSIFLFKLQKDVYSRGLKGVIIATDNPFLSVEEWSL